MRDLQVHPPAPIHNAGGVTVTFALELTEAVTGEDPPVLGYELSGQPELWTSVDVLEALDALNWSGHFALPASAGQFEAETLTLRWRAEDDLGNVGDRILSPHQFQVYQNALPPLDPPGMLDVWPLPGGQVGLMWPECIFRPIVNTQSGPT